MMESRMMIHRVAPVWPAQVWAKRIKQAALAGAFGLIALAAVAPGVARAEDSGESTLFGSMLKSLGIGGENHIEYRERPPLVVPPSRDLPPPQTSRAVRDPNWPVDPQAGDPRKKGDLVHDLDRIPVEPGSTGAGAPNPTGDTAAIPPSQKASGGFFSNLFGSGSRQAGPIGSAPTRKSLTDPPADYESASPSQPYGAAAPAPAKPVTPESALQTTQPGAPGL
jgi:hypothetical protein